MKLNKIITLCLIFAMVFCSCSKKPSALDASSSLALGGDVSDTDSNVSSNTNTSSIPTSSENNSSTHSQSASDKPSGTKIGGYVWEFSGEASYRSGSIKCPADSKAICSDKNLPSAYTLECDISTSYVARNGIAINSTDKSGYYILQLNAAQDEVVLYKLNGDYLDSVASANYTLDDSKMYHVKLAVSNFSLKVFIAEQGKSLPSYQIIDAKIEKTTPNCISFTCRTGELTVKNVKIGKYDLTSYYVESYKNPVAEGADPYVLYHEGTYYLYSTNAVDLGYRVYTSKDMSSWTYKGLCLSREDAYGTPTSSAGFWAPEVYYHDGLFYMLYTVDEHLGIATSESPLGPFKSPKQSFINNDKKEIDGHLFFDDDGKVYIYFVRCDSNVGEGWGNEIFGAEFDMETFTYKNEKCLIYPQKNTWEWIGDHGYVAEGPAMLKHNGKYYLTYSANGYTSHDYAVGLAISDSPLGDYTKYNQNPILKKDAAVSAYGTGHHTFTVSPDNKELFIVYHIHASETDVHPRMICIDRCYFEYDAALGYDVLRVMGPTNTIQPIPSGANKKKS